MYYKLIFTYETETESTGFAACVQAFSEEGLNDAIRNIVKERSIPSNYSVKTEKTTLKKLTDEELRRIICELEDGYLALKYGMDIFDSEEYTRLKFKQYKNYLAKRNLYENLRKYLCVCRKVKQTVDISKTTIAEFDKLVLESISFDVCDANGKYVN